MSAAARRNKHVLYCVTLVMPTLFRDVFTGDEMFDSSHEKNIVDDIVYSMQGCYTPIYTTHADGKVTVRTAI
eukprot:COSAG02_NODE_63103_length_264_cov_0.624242_1_plen_71_part_10